MLVLYKDFLGKSVFLGIALKFMESQGGAKGFGAMGTHTGVSLCCTAEVLCADSSLKHQMSIWTGKFIPVNDCP